MTHFYVEFRHVAALHGHKILIPEALPLRRRFGRVRTAGVDLFKIPALGIKALQQAALYRRIKIHFFLPFASLRQQPFCRSF